VLAWRLRPWLLVKQLLEGAIDETRRLVLGNWWLLVIRWVMGHRWLATSEKLAELRSKGLLTWQWLLNSCVCMEGTGGRYCWQGTRGRMVDVRLGRNGIAGREERAG
jgi:hypothetical protein